MNFRFEVLVSLKEGLLDPQGKTVQDALPTLGWPNVTGVRVGKHIELSVDATEAPRKLLHARLVIPATPGPLTLYYPKWIPGEHQPNGPINDLSGLTIRAGSR